MITITYKCDKCGRTWNKEDKDAPQLWIIGMKYTSHESKYSYNMGKDSPYKDQQWCRPCMDELGLIITSTVKNTPEEKRLTFEDLVRELIAEQMPQD